MCWMKTPWALANELQLTDAIKGLLQSERVYGYSFEGVRYDAGDKMVHVEGKPSISPSNVTTWARSFESISSRLAL